MLKLATLLGVLATAFSFQIDRATAGTWEEMLPEIVDGISSSGAKLFFMGDHHSRDNHKTAITDLIVGLRAKNPEWNCYLDELDPTWYQAAIDDTLNGKAPHTTLAARVIENLPRFVLAQGYDLKKLAAMIATSLPETLFQALTTTGTRLFAIDEPKTEAYLDFMNNFPNPLAGEMATDDEWDTRNRLQLIERNEHMADRIRTLLKNETCTRAIVLLGEDHMLQFGKLYLTDEQVVPVPQLLAQEIPFQTGVLLFDKEEQDKYQADLGPNDLRGGLERISLEHVTYTPTIARW